VIADDDLFDRVADAFEEYLLHSMKWNKCKLGFWAGKTLVLLSVWERPRCHEQYFSRSGDILVAHKPIKQLFANKKEVVLLPFFCCFMRHAHHAA